MSKLNRISVVVPGNSASAAAERDGWVAVFTAILGTPSAVVLERYNDTASGFASWGYYGKLFGLAGGEPMVCTVSCTGITHPPLGANIQFVVDPGPGTTYVWNPVGAVPSLMTSAGNGGGISPPAGNNNYYVWNIPGISPTAPADFTAAVTAVNNAVPGTTVRQGFKYVDSISGAWQVWWICFGAGSAEYAASAATILANNNILYMVTSSGTPHPPTGSSQPAVALPAFTQIFTSIDAPLSFGPQR